MIEWIHPSALFFIAAALYPFLKGQNAKILQCGVPAIAFLSLLATGEGTYDQITLMGQSVVLGRVDRLSLIFGYIFTISAFIGMVYSLHVKQKGETVAALIYAGSALGAVFSGDLFSLFLFWEIMAFSSVFLVWYAGAGSWGAGIRYLMIHIFGGVCLLIGIVLYVSSQKNSLTFSNIPLSGVGPALILLGVLINAAAVPFHAWVSDAYPKATVTGAVFMSAFTTKTSVYLLIRGFAGTDMLILLGVIMALYGAIYAFLENDIRKVLAYGIISQVGYMVTAVGLGTPLALNGASAHAFSHILYKGLLMMATGSVILMTGKRKMSELGGLYKTMPFTFAMYMVGALSIAGFPFFSGFVSKAMIISAAGESHRAGIVALLTLVSCGTFLYTGLKLPYFVFFGKDAKIAATDPPAHMRFGMGIAAFLCFIIGVWPPLLYGALPFPVDYHPYTLSHIITALQMLFLTALPFLWLKRFLKSEDRISLDMDWLYRRGTPIFLWIAKKPLAWYEGVVTEAYRFLLIAPAKKIADWAWKVDVHLVDGFVNLTGVVTLLESRVSEAFDVHIIDGIVNGSSTILDRCSKKLRQLQTGLVQNYILAMVAGIAVFAVFFVF
ncbi:MAG: Na(+)/H(+) antiporter subunit D [Nitrospirota bacterium]